MVPHWLAIEGVQPNIPENAPVERQKLKRPRAEVAHHKVARKKQETGTLALDCVRTVACSSAAAVLYGNINPGCTGPAQPSSVQQDGAGEQQAAAVIPPVRQLLSAELQLYLERVKRVLTNTQTMPDDAPGGPFAAWQTPSHTGRPHSSHHMLCIYISM